MLSKLVIFAAIATAVAAPSVAAADVIDDFTLVGGGYTITFSEPATGVTLDHIHGVYLTDSVTATVNGVPGSTGTIQILASPLSPLPSLVLGLSSFPSPYQLPLYGPVIDSYVVVPISNPTPGNPDALQMTLVPGVYSFTVQSVDSISQANFQLTLTQEASPTGVTPEPGTLPLLSTGLAGGWSLLSRRRAMDQS